MSELNKQLLKAIGNGYYDEFETLGFDSEKAANECEKICLQAQIDLLYGVNNLIEHAENPRTFTNKKIEQLQEQLKQLNL